MITNYLADLVLRNYLTSMQTSPSQISSVYVGLSTTTPTPVAGTNQYTEPVGNGYQRVLLGMYNQSATQKMQITGGQASNKEIIYFPEVVNAGWGICTYLLIFDGNTAGAHLLAYSQLANPINPTLGTIPIIRISDLVIKFNEELVNITYDGQDNHTVVSCVNVAAKDSSITIQVKPEAGYTWNQVPTTISINGESHNFTAGDNEVYYYTFTVEDNVSIVVTGTTIAA